MSRKEEVVSAGKGVSDLVILHNRRSECVWLSVRSICKCQRTLRWEWIQEILLWGLAGSARTRLSLTFYLIPGTWEKELLLFVLFVLWEENFLLFFLLNFVCCFRLQFYLYAVASASRIALSCTVHFDGKREGGSETSRASAETPWKLLIVSGVAFCIQKCGVFFFDFLFYFFSSFMLV